MATHAVAPSRLVSSPTSNDIDEGSQAIVRRVVISVVAFIGFILFLFGGLVYMSQTYSPKQYSVQVLLNSLTTSNFHARSTQPLSTTKWEATVTIQNNHKDNRKILIGSLESALLYKENAFSCASLSLKSPVKIRSMKQRTVTLRFSNTTCSPEKLPLNYDVLNEEAVRERRTGRVRFGLQMRMVVSSGIIRSPFSARFSMIDTRCLEMVDVEFAHGVGEGRLVGHDVKMKMNSTMSTHGY